jgi:hypothetical protein
MLKLRLPEELVGDQATLEGPDSPPQEVRAVPMEGPLDPVLEEAVESQPQVAPPETPAEEKKEEEAPQEAQPGPARRGTPLGILAALGAGALVVLGVALGGASASANMGGTAGGAAPRPPAPPSTGLWE